MEDPSDDALGGPATTAGGQRSGDAATSALAVDPAVDRPLDPPPGPPADPPPDPAPDPPPPARRIIAAPFRTGLLVGFGLLVAYAVYLSLATIRTTLVVLAISALLAIGLDPVVQLLMRRRLRRPLLPSMRPLMRRGIAVAITYLGMLAILAGALYAIIPPIVQQVAALVTTLPKRLQALSTDPTIRSLDDKFHLIQRLQAYLENIGPGAASGVFTAAGVAVDLIVVLILTLYFLAGLPRITEAAYGLAPRSKRARIKDIGDRVIKQMGGYLGGATLIAIQAGLVAGIFSWIVGLPYPLAIGAGALVLDFVPVVGPVIIGVSIALLGFTQSLVIGIVAGAFYICQHLFEAYWLYPRIMRRTVHISTAAVIVAIVVGAALLGVIGAILAVPVAAAAQLIVREVLLPRQERS